MEFKDIALHPDLQRGIAEAEYFTCMPVQEQVLSHAFGGQDLYVQSQTGTGKTAAFLVVIYQRLLAEEYLAGKKALIMAPTRELAVQIEAEAKVLAKYLPFKIGSFYGGVGYAQQEKLLRENAQILVGTPGRVLDLNGSGHMNLMDLAFLVIDEADRMFDMGFYPDLRKLIKVVPPADRRQTMLFSATLNSWVKNLAWEYMREPFEIEIEPETVTVEEIDQLLYHVPSDDKFKLLLGILQREKPESAIIFCNTKRYTEIVAKRLRMNGFDCEFIIGDLPQMKRLKVIEDLKAGKIRFLVATDVAARGLDVEALALVVNFDLPNEAENYVHRIGRTARAGKTGRAITLASEQDVYELIPIERYIGKKIPSETATADLYGDDSSAGARIRSDFQEDRGDDRFGRGRRDDARRGGSRDRDGGRDGAGGRDRDSSRDGAGGRGGRRSGNGAQSSRQDGGRRGRGEGRGGDVRRDGEARRGGGDERRGADSRRADAGKPGRRDEQNLDAQDLSGMSFDERMAAYKKKYSSGKGAGAEASGNPGAEAGKEPGRKRQKPQGERERERKGGEREQGSGGSRRRGGKPQRKGEGKQGAGGAEQPSQAAESAPAKKGILSRLLGVFKKS